MLKGGTLADVLKRGERLPEGSLCAVAQRVLLGLRNMQTRAALHHYDIKPSNIGLLRSGDYKSTVIFDFGSALPLGAAHIYLLSSCLPQASEGCSSQIRICDSRPWTGLLSTPTLSCT